jgi:hypothetical protein
MEFFVNLLIGNLSSFYLKMIIMPLCTMVLLYTVYIIMLKIKKPNMSFSVDSKLTLLMSISITTVLYNVFWLYVLYSNGVYLFNWSEMTFSKNNIYIMLVPLLLGYLVLIILYFRTQSQIKRSL